MTKKAYIEDHPRLFMFFLGIFLIAVLYIFLNRYFEKKASRALFEKMSSLNFSGKVIKETPLTSRVSLYQMKIASSSVEEFDPRKTGDDYLFVIKRDSAELILSSYSIRVGDSINFQGKTGAVHIFKNGKYNGIERKRTYFLSKMRRLARRKHEL